MMVRRYVVKDMPEAIALIRKDLGKDAVILSTKKVSQTKWFGIWRTRRIEVLAATGDGVPTRVNPTQYQASQVTPAPAPSTTPVPSPATVLPERASAPVLPAQQPMVEEHVAETGFSEPVFPVATKSLVPEAELEAAPSVVVEQSNEERMEAGKLEAVYKEISDVKRLLKNTLGQADADSVQSIVARYLLRQGVNEEHVNAWLKDAVDMQSGVAAQERPERKPLQVMKDFLNQRILEELGPLVNPEPILPDSRIVALVGPTGVGKTTSVAKLAALHVLAGSRKVGLITTDTFRIAAVDQLRTYANILNVPLQVVYQPSELPAAVDALADCDLILMDTSGRNFKYEQNVVEVRNILTSIPVDETFLVLSLTSKSEDLERVANAFAGLPVDKFLFTKADETSTYGAILNLLTTFRKPLSYLTTGQSVPDDIEVANFEKLLRLIVGGAA